MVLDDLETLSTSTTDLSKKRKRHWCDDPSYRKSTLKLIREIPYAGAFHDVKGITKFEASVRWSISHLCARRQHHTQGMVHWKDDLYITVFDNLFSLGIIKDRFGFRAAGNKLVGDPGIDSQFEGVSVMPENGHVLLLHEALEHDGTETLWRRCGVKTSSRC